MAKLMCTVINMTSWQHEYRRQTGGQCVAVMPTSSRFTNTRIDLIIYLNYHNNRRYELKKIPYFCALRVLNIPQFYKPINNFEQIVNEPFRRSTLTHIYIYISRAIHSTCVATVKFRKLSHSSRETCHRMWPATSAQHSTQAFSSALIPASSRYSKKAHASWKDNSTHEQACVLPTHMTVTFTQQYHVVVNSPQAVFAPVICTATYRIKLLTRPEMELGIRRRYDAERARQSGDARLYMDAVDVM